MAIYHCNVKVISRASGRSATGAIAYRAGISLKDERTGFTHDYTQKSGVDYSAILAPSNAPDWVHDRAVLWNTVEQSEKRKDAQLCREVEVALPRELAPAQMQSLVREYAENSFVSKGMVADINVHDIESDNPHAHILLTMRTIDEQGFGQKERAWNQRTLLQSWRQGWAQCANQALQEAGQEARIDHRSLEAQGIERVPQIHLGAAVIEMEKRGERTERYEAFETIEKKNAEIIELAAHRAKLEAEISHEVSAQPLMAAAQGAEMVLEMAPAEETDGASCSDDVSLNETQLDEEALKLEACPPVAELTEEAPARGLFGRLYSRVSSWLSREASPEARMCSAEKVSEPLKVERTEVVNQISAAVFTPPDALEKPRAAVLEAFYGRYEREEAQLVYRERESGARAFGVSNDLITMADSRPELAHVAAAMAVASTKFGVVEISGAEAFRQQAIEVAVAHELKVSFADKEMQAAFESQQLAHAARQHGPEHEVSQTSVERLDQENQLSFSALARQHRAEELSVVSDVPADPEDPASEFSRRLNQEVRERAQERAARVSSQGLEYRTSYTFDAQHQKMMLTINGEPPSSVPTSVLEQIRQQDDFLKNHSMVRIKTGRLDMTQEAAAREKIFDARGHFVESVSFRELKAERTRTQEQSMGWTLE